MVTMLAISKNLTEIIETAKPRLHSITENRASEKPYADKWSIKEILGHLIDSAANNHHRIVRMQQTPALGTFVYDQLHWVNLQHYQAEPWASVVQFWYRYNAHLAHSIAHVDAGALINVCDVGYAAPATLKFVIEDYVRHVRHHLDQIFSDADPRERQQWVERVPS